MRHIKAHALLTFALGLTLFAMLCAISLMIWFRATPADRKVARPLSVPQKVERQIPDIKTYRDARGFALQYPKTMQVVNGENGPQLMNAQNNFVANIVVVDDVSDFGWHGYMGSYVIDDGMLCPTRTKKCAPLESVEKTNAGLPIYLLQKEKDPSGQIDYVIMSEQGEAVVFKTKPLATMSGSESQENRAQMLNVIKTISF